ncbi:hypothetical protein [Sinimarinibacterium thermocellulolyticum]|uniref:Uncharacterized protein n=1 Tax=Sinimarinibacterium thermocellulolyticum TaxID=3170016 RepID=A0ABV2A899_9GAMM
MAVKGWSMAAVAVVVAAGTYFTLETIYPPSKNGDGDLRVVSPDSVFGNAPAPAESGPAVAEIVPAKTPDAADRALDAAMAPSEEDLRVTDESLAADQPEPTATPAAEDRTEADAALAPADAVEDMADDAAEIGAAATMQGPAPVVTPAATPRPTQRPAPVRTPVPRLTPWWGPESNTQLSLVYAGSAAYTRAIVLLFNGAFDDARSAQPHLRVRDAAGRLVAGTWEVGANNRRMLLFPVAHTGLYTVTVGPGLADRSGRTVGKQMQGPVRVE